MAISYKGHRFPPKVISHAVSSLLCTTGFLIALYLGLSWIELDLRGHKAGHKNGHNLKVGLAPITEYIVLEFPWIFLASAEIDGQG